VAVGLVGPLSFRARLGNLGQDCSKKRPASAYLIAMLANRSHRQNETWKINAGRSGANSSSDRQHAGTDCDRFAARFTGVVKRASCWPNSLTARKLRDQMRVDSSALSFKEGPG
jgi:hypothetical protein